MFQTEKAMDQSKPFEGGGSNESVLTQMMGIGGNDLSEHEVYTFKDKIETCVDLLKRYIFKVHLWVSLAIIFLASTVRVDITSLIYIGNVFAFLWLGTDYYVKPLQIIIKRWDFLLKCNFIIIIIKLANTIIACNYCDSLDLPCQKVVMGLICEMFVSHVSDGIIFATIILQRRIFLSYYFFNVIRDTAAANYLSSRFATNDNARILINFMFFFFRGAEMIEELRLQEVDRQINVETKNLVKLKKKMESLKLSAHLPNVNLSMSHDNAIHSGSYYMFIEDSESEQVSFIADRRSGLQLFTSHPSQASSTAVDTNKSIQQFVKEFYSKLLIEIVHRMHKMSINYRSIIKAMDQEKETLVDAITQRKDDSSHLM